MQKLEYTTALSVLLTKEDDTIVAFAPALNLGSCGRNQTEAIKHLGDAIELFFSELLEMGALDKALRELGWRPVEENRFAVPRTSDLPAKVQRNIPTHLLARRNISVRVPVTA